MILETLKARRDFLAISARAIGLAMLAAPIIQSETAAKTQIKALLSKSPIPTDPGSVLVAPGLTPLPSRPEVTYTG